MASNLVSRLLPTRAGSPSIYETLRQYDESSEGSDLEQGANTALDEENLGLHSHAFDPKDIRLNASHLTNRSTSNARHARRTKDAKAKGARILEADDADDEVPASLLIEGEEQRQPFQRRDDLAATAPWDSAVPTRESADHATWDRRRFTQAHNPLRPRERTHSRARTRPDHELRGLSLADPKQKAMWRWANVENLDTFLLEVYLYYLGNGFLSIMLQRTLQMVTFAFVAGFTIFLGNCINYDKLRHSGNMSQILVPKCARQMSGGANLAIWALSLCWIMKLFQYILDIRRLLNLHDFYRHLLGVSDVEIQSISWQEIVSRLMVLRDANPTTASMLPAKHRRFLGSQSKQRMDAHDIANRLMRKDNYLIALFNKDILDLTLPLPWIGKRQLFSRTLEWNINQCVIDYVFNEHGQVRPLFLKDTHRKALSEGLRRRFKFAGTLNIFVAPFLVAYFLVHYFFSYFTEYQRNPSQIGSRQYSPLAEWKFREFNELRHLFQRRTNMSYPFASRYINQFPKDKTVQVARFVAFVAGALASVLAVASVIDPEMFLNFEITKDRSVIFYLGVFGSIWAVARGILPEENLVYEPEFALQEVIGFTHYKPGHWEGLLHSDYVRKEFARLYQLKLLVFVEEILSMIFTPFVLWFSLPYCSDGIIDFFREFTVHVDGLGYVCSFAEFKFKQQDQLAQRPGGGQGNARPGATNIANAPLQALREDYYATNDQKLEASYWGFMNDYARNPKTDIRFPYAGHPRRFNLPPAFPGPMSPPTIASQGQKPTPRAGSQDSQLEKSRAYRSTRQGLGNDLERVLPTGGPPRFGTTARVAVNESPPLTSILLDPHHQPAASGFGQAFASQAKRSGKSRLQAGPMSPGLDEQRESATQLPEDAKGIVEGSGEGILGSSWKMNQDQETSGEDEDVDAVVGDKGPGGILGMMVQFQKAQGDSRSTT